VSEPVGKSVEEYLAEQKAEWGKYVAAEPIFFDGVRAFNAGSPVPASHVERGVVTAEQVSEVTKTSEKKKG
jgi:hypothetical protein